MVQKPGLLLVTSLLISAPLCASGKDVSWPAPELVLSPAHPLVGQPINAVFRSVWPDGCTPTLRSIDWTVTPQELPVVPRTDIEVLLDVQAGQACPAAVTEFEVPLALGPVTTNEVFVTVAVPSPTSAPPEILLQTQFTAANPTPHALVLGNRFEVRARWRLPAPGGVGGIAEGDAEPVPGATADSGLLWFFQPDNWELMVKVLDGCEHNGHFWVLGSGSTNVEFDLTVTDSLTQAVWTHHNPQSQLAGTFADIEAFLCEASGQP